MNYSAILIYKDIPIDSYWGEWGDVYLDYSYPIWVIAKKISEKESQEIIKIDRGVYREGRIFKMDSISKINTYYGMSMINAHKYMEKYVKKV